MSGSIRRHAHLEQELGEYESGHDAALRATATAMATASTASCVVLVEGISDQIAVEALAARRGVSLDDAGVVVVPVGGAHAMAAHLDRFDLARVRVVALCDRNEHPMVSVAIVRAGLDETAVHVCDADLEDELIRAVGEKRLEELMAQRGELPSFRTMSKQPAWRDRPFDERAHRWIRSHARRSSVYARVLIDAVDDDRVPDPLDRLLRRALG